LDDFYNPQYIFKDEKDETLLDGNPKLAILHRYLTISIVSNQNKFILNFEHNPGDFNIDECNEVNNCKIIFTFKEKTNKFVYVFTKNIVFQTGNILNLNFSFDDSYKPENYLKQIPSQDDFANTTIDTLEPYRTGCTFDDIKRTNNTLVYFGYSTPPINPEDNPDLYKEMLLRYCDIANMLKADICYYSNLIYNEANYYISQFPIISITSFNSNISLQYDMSTATILSLSFRATVITTMSGYIDIGIDIFAPYHLFGTFQWQLVPNKLDFFTQLVPVPLDYSNNAKGLYEVSVDAKLFGAETPINFDSYYSYPGSKIFGNFGTGEKLGVYLPCYWMTNCSSLLFLVMAEDQFTPTHQFKLIDTNLLNTDNFLNIGIIKDMGTPPIGAADADFGTSNYFKDAEHIDSNNTFTVTIQNSDPVISYDLP
jgi:hypothetical protein